MSFTSQILPAFYPLYYRLPDAGEPLALGGQRVGVRLEHNFTVRRKPPVGGIGFGRIVASEIEVPNMLVNMV